jgi:hypothetical protein
MQSCKELIVHLELWQLIDVNLKISVANALKEWWRVKGQEDNRD